MKFVAQLAVPNKEPVIFGAFRDPVIDNPFVNLPKPDTSKLADGTTVPIPILPILFIAIYPPSDIPLFRYLPNFATLFALSNLNPEKAQFPNKSFVPAKMYLSVELVLCATIDPCTESNSRAFVKGAVVPMPTNPLELIVILTEPFVSIARLWLSLVPNKAVVLNELPPCTKKLLIKEEVGTNDAVIA